MRNSKTFTKSGDAWLVTLVYNPSTVSLACLMTPTAKHSNLEQGTMAECVVARDGTEEVNAFGFFACYGCCYNSFP